MYHWFPAGSITVAVRSPYGASSGTRTDFAPRQSPVCRPHPYPARRGATRMADAATCHHHLRPAPGTNHQSGSWHAGRFPRANRSAQRPRRQTPLQELNQLRRTARVQGGGHRQLILRRVLRFAPCGDEPEVAGQVFHVCLAIPVRLRHRLGKRCSAGVDCAFVDRIRIVHRENNPHRRR